MTIEEYTDAKQERWEVADVEKNRKKAKNDLTILMSNPSDLKGAELLDHKITHSQCVYEDYGHKLSVYLACSLRTKHQSNMVNREHPKIVQGDLMWRFGAGDTKENPFRASINNMRSIGGYSAFVEKS